MRARTLFGWSLIALLCPGTAAGNPLTPDADEASALQALGAELPTAHLIWTRGGAGSGKIYYSSVSNPSPQKLSEGTDDHGPRWSPDGREIIFVRGERPFGPYEVMWTKADFTGLRTAIPGGHSASWTRDGRYITAVDRVDGNKILKCPVDLIRSGQICDEASGTAEVIYDGASYNGYPIGQAAELRAGGRFLLLWWGPTSDNHVTAVFDLQTEQYLSNDQMAAGDCSPAWSPDGSYLLNTARTASRPVRRVRFYPEIPDVERPSEPVDYFVGLDTEDKYAIHGQRVSNDGRWVAFGGILYGGPKANGKREIYLWRVNEHDPHGAVRLTFDTAHDEQPSLFIGSAEPGEGSDGEESEGASGSPGPAPADGSPSADGGIGGSDPPVSEAPAAAPDDASLVCGCRLTSRPGLAAPLLLVGLLALAGRRRRSPR